MPIRVELTTRLSFKAHVFEVPIDIDNLEASIREHTRQAVLDFLGEEVIQAQDRELTVEVEVVGMATTDPQDTLPVGIRKKDMTG